tara:strand:- start:45 stop:860 length:816 start_codon:yes stop_codon:yes gene_type:complete
MNQSKNLKILVIGDECRDVFVTGGVGRLSPEAPIPVLNPSETKSNPGMAGNVDANLKAMGYDPILVSNMQPVHTSRAEGEVYKTTEIVKTRYVDEQTGYILLRVDENDHVNMEFTSELLERKIHSPLSDFDLVIVADYNKGFLTEELMQYIFENSKCSFLDTKRRIGSWAKDVTYIKINAKEFESFDHKEFLESEDMLQKVVVTEGGGGCRINGEWRYVNKVNVKDVSGAGDTFMAALATGYATHDNIFQAMEEANSAARKVVQQRGVVTV